MNIERIERRRTKGWKMPAMPFYFDNWRKAPEIRALDLDVRMIWFEMLGFMWESTKRGYLTLNGNPVITPVISKMIGVDINVLERAIQQMEQFNVFSRSDDGTIFCRKMVRDEEIRAKKSIAGKVGMKKRYEKNNGSVISPVITKAIKLEIEHKKHEIQFFVKDLPNVRTLKNQLTFKEAIKLQTEHGISLVKKVLLAMENKKDLNK